MTAVPPHLSTPDTTWWPIRLSQALAGRTGRPQLNDDAPAPRTRPGHRPARAENVHLADTSAWIEYDRATGSSVDERITALISEDGPLVVTEPVVMEVLAGARTQADAEQLRRLLLRGGLLAFDGATDCDAAALIYRRCRQAGVTPRGMIDCMIAAVAWRQGASLLCRDVDLEGVASVIGIGLDEASAR